MNETAREQPVEAKLEELISIMEKTDSRSSAVRRRLLSNPDVIDNLARRYRPIRAQLEVAKGEYSQEIIKNPIYRTVSLIERLSYHNVTAGTIRKLLVERYGFDDTDLSKFDPKDDGDNRFLNRLYWDNLFLLEGMYSPGAMGSQFRMPIKEFKGRSRLDMLKSQSFDDRVVLREHLIMKFKEGLGMNAT